MNAFLRGRDGKLVLRLVALFALALMLAVLGCGGDRRPPPAAPSIEAPADALPPEFDLAVRVDVGRLRSALGQATVDRIRSSLGERDPSRKFLLDVLERTDIFVLGSRLENDTLADVVVAAEGDYRGLNPRAYPVDPPWQAPVDLGGDVLRYDRAKPKKRTEEARLYLRSNRMIVIVSEAVIDSVENVIEKHIPGRSVRPPERGLLSMSYRVRSGIAPRMAERFPLIWNALGDLRSLEAWVDQLTLGFRMQSSFEFTSEPAAQEAGRVLEAVRESVATDGRGRSADFARHAKVTTVGNHVLIDIDLPLEILGRTLGDAFR